MEYHEFSYRNILGVVEAEEATEEELRLLKIARLKKTEEELDWMYENNWGVFIETENGRSWFKVKSREDRLTLYQGKGTPSHSRFEGF